MMQTPSLDLATLRDHMIGVDAPIRTPYGERLLVYADYTASGRCLDFVEDYCRELAVLYANSHTEDSLTGHTTTHLLHEAEAAIKASVNAGPSGKVIACGSGSTGSIHKLQEILGVAIAPATRQHVLRLAKQALGQDGHDRLVNAVQEQCPVVFVGPFEHHSNEVTWREGLCEVVEVDLTPDGALDLAHLEALLTDPRWIDRVRIGSFSAASNVTGVTAPVHDIARLLHQHNAFALFDYAAAAPYVPIDMNPDGDPDAALDAVFFSPHKFLGGPGSAGVLVFHERLYPSSLSPSVGGGGTVVYVNSSDHAFDPDIEAREKAGTPGVFQTVRAALALMTKDALGIDDIQAREHALLARAFDRWGQDDQVEILGPQDPGRRIGIVSFNLRDGRGEYLHPKLVTALLNDLFGIQSRAGCSCAGPYGHRLLGIDEAQESRLMDLSCRGIHGIKPGWCRVGFHYAMDDAEVDYIIEAISFIAEHGCRFVPCYHFDVRSGGWTHQEGASPMPTFSLDAALSARPGAEAQPSLEERQHRYAQALHEARQIAAALPDPACETRLDGELADLQFFALSS